MAESAAEVRALRAQVRTWRRGRASRSLGEALVDGYVVVFSVVIVGAMAVSLVAGLRRELDAACGSVACTEGRTALPVLAALACLAATAAVAGVLGPVVVGPAVDSWLMPAPVDRAALLRPRWWLAVAGSFVVLPVVVAATALTGGSLAAVSGYAVATTALAVGAVGAATLAQTGRTGAARTTTTVATVLLWIGLVVLALGGAGSVARALGGWPASAATSVVVVSVVVGAAVAGLALRRLGRIPRGATDAGTAAAVSGALGGLDLALAQDVLLARHWRARASVRSRRGGPAGGARLAWTDLVRLRRSPRLLVAPVAVLVVPWAAVTVGAGRVGVLFGAVALFLSALPLATGLRVLTRTPGLARLLPQRAWQVRLASLAVPTAVTLLAGAALTAVFAAVDEVTPGMAVGLGLATGASAAASVVRWVSGRPPDYARPLVSTPMGAAPTNLYGSIARGFDVALVTSAPVLLVPGAGGPLLSLAVSAVVVGYFLLRT